MTAILTGLDLGQRRSYPIPLPPKAIELGIEPIERDVLDYSTRAMTVKEIGAVCFYGPTKIKGIRAAVLDKLGADNLQQGALKSAQIDLFSTRIAQGNTYVKSLPPVQLLELELAALGLTCKEAADRRGVSPRTVQSNRDEILQSWGMPSLTVAIRLGLETGKLPLYFEPS